MPRKQYHYHYIYKTTNILNDKFYIGMHSTHNLEDGYVGSGKRLWRSIKKHGKENHKCEILEYLPDRKSLKNREREIVNEELLHDSMCMNLILGGGGGFEAANNSVTREQRIIRGRKGGLRNKHRLDNDPEHRARIIRTAIKNILKAHRDGKIEYNTFQNRKHTDESKLKISKSKRGKYRGSTNFNAKAVIDDVGQEFGSLIECAKFHGLHPETISRKIKRGIFKFKK